MSGAAGVEAPMTLSAGEVDPELIDDNGHMAALAYAAAFSRASKELIDRLHVSSRFQHEDNRTVFILHWHVTYLREVMAGARLRMAGRLLDRGDKLIHYFIEMHVEGEEGYLAATSEHMEIHIDLATRRPAPFLPHIARILDSHVAAQAHLPWPSQAGHMAIRRKEGA